MSIGTSGTNSESSAPRRTQTRTAIFICLLALVAQIQSRQPHGGHRNNSDIYMSIGTSGTNSESSAPRRTQTQTAIFICLLALVAQIQSRQPHGGHRHRQCDIYMSIGTSGTNSESSAPRRTQTRTAIFICLLALVAQIQSRQPHGGHRHRTAIFICLLALVAQIQSRQPHGGHRHRQRYLYVYWH